MIIDSHCHLNMLDLDKYDGDLAQLVAATHDSGVGQMLNVGINLETAQAVIDVANQFPNVFASAGLHPSDVKGQVPTRDELLLYINQPKVVAIGETGLDYHYNSELLDEMRESFRLHIQLAIETKKPLIIHTRDAREDTIAIMQEENAAQAGGVMHCFTESWEMAQAALELGFYISFSGIVTFKNAKELQDVATRVPLERILIETDSPYLTPTPFRGKPNEPQYVRYVAEKIAELKNVSFDEVAQQSTRNFQSLFNLS
ncbi:MAG: TatD family deoxyribonuclease [Coxiella sp. (in: Bacteria)]|nr:MAG: TatD family deoxyribonuclease [Coxiella sp. (in: g-proteobacteria)]